MADAAGRIEKLEVRCPCGESFENVETYLVHKRLYRTYEVDKVGPKTPIERKSLASASTSASTPKSAARWCGRTSKNYHALQQRGRSCGTHKQQTTERLNSSDLAQISELDSGEGSVSAAGERPIPLSAATAKKTRCPCGKSFASEKALNQHLRDSKIHQLGKSTSKSKSKATTSGSVTFTAPHLPPTSISPASGSLPGTIPTSVLSLALLFPCNCGHNFETQRVLDLHKRDSLFHKRQADKPSTRNEQWDDSLVSSFTSLNLESVSSRARLSESRFPCVCGRTFTNQEALEQHKQEKRRLVWKEKGEKGEKLFKTPRPQYHEDEYLRDTAGFYARQYCGGE